MSLRGAEGSVRAGRRSGDGGVLSPGFELKRLRGEVQIQNRPSSIKEGQQSVLLYRYLRCTPTASSTTASVSSLPELNLASRIRCPPAADYGGT
jgi:hypothetical protein